MKQKNIIIAVILVAILAIGGYLAISSGDEEVATTNESNSTQEAGSTTETFTAEQVAEHNSEDDCWTIVDGNVYDLTSYIPRHPGGSDILLACGTDGSSLFNERKTEDGQEVGSGSSHSNSAAKSLEQLKIGTLENN
jgi:cytochrome b involved in lipid metabolism